MICAGKGRQREVCPVYCLMSKLALEPGDKELNAAGCQRLKKQSNSGNARALGVSFPPPELTPVFRGVPLDLSASCNPDLTSSNWILLQRTEKKKKRPSLVLQSRVFSTTVN